MQFTFPPVLFWTLLLNSFIIHATEIYSHRGAAGLSPENTIRGIETALRLGVDAIDMDVGLTRDGVVVLSHDPFLNPEFTQFHNGQPLLQPVYLKELDLFEVKQYRVGQTKAFSPYKKQFPLQQCQVCNIPTLEEILYQFKKNKLNQIKIQIEIKTDPDPTLNTPTPSDLVKEILKVIYKINLPNTIEIHSFDWRNLVLLPKDNPRIIRSFLTDEPANQSSEFMLKRHLGYDLSHDSHHIPIIIKKLGGRVWCPHFSSVSLQNVTEAHRIGLRVNVWTVDDPEDMLKMLELGVDGIITNRPDILLGLMAAQGKALPNRYYSHFNHVASS